ncbi:hypothetical protein P9112_005968 [Eukaryota sp. TZLM1-RC]
MSAHGLQKYTLVSLLGEGSYSKVYYGYNNETLLEVAVKVMNVSKTSNTSESSFRREIAFLKKFNNPHVCRLYDVVEGTSDTVYIVLEFCDWALLKDSDIGKVKLNLNVESLQDIFHQILFGLCYIHEQGVVHRDIKPSNILVARTLEKCFHKSRRVVLSDFGVSTLFDDTSDKLLRGSPLFLSPELISLETSKQYQNDPVIDCWATGVTFYILAFGVSPWTQTASRMELFHEIQDYAAGKTEIHIPVDEGLKDLILGLLNADPSLRLTAKQALQHPWFGDYIPKVDSKMDWQRDDIDSSVAAMNHMGFKFNTKPDTRSSTTISNYERFLSIVDSNIHLSTLCSIIINCAPEEVKSAEFLQLESNMKKLIVSESLIKSSKDYLGLMTTWLKVVEQDCHLAIKNSSLFSKFNCSNLIYVKNNILPVIHQNLEEFSYLLEEGSCVANVSNSWRSIDYNKLKSKIYSRINTFEQNLSFNSSVELVCNCDTLLKARPQVSHHVVFVDFGIPNIWSDTLVREDCSYTAPSETSILTPFAAIDLLCELITNSITFSPKNTVIKAGIWNEVVEGDLQLKLACLVCASSHVTSSDLSDTGVTFSGFLTKSIIVTDCLLNGKFSFTSGEDFTLIRVDIPVPAREFNLPRPMIDTSTGFDSNQIDCLHLGDIYSSCFDTLGDDSCYSTILTDYGYLTTDKATL